MDTLILYGTKYGSTKKAVSFLEKQLNKKIDIINLEKSKKDIDLDNYKQVIIGGSIYAGKIQKSISKFCLENEKKLLNKKLGLFLCCGNENNISTQFENSFNKNLLNHAFAKEYFGYEYNLEKMNFFFKIIVKKIANIKESKSNIKYENIKKFSNQMKEAK